MPSDVASATASACRVSPSVPLRALGLAIGCCSYSDSRVSSTICDKIKRVLFLSSAGAMYQGDSAVLVASRHA